MARTVNSRKRNLHKEGRMRKQAFKARVAATNPTAVEVDKVVKTGEGMIMVRKRTKSNAISTRRINKKKVKILNRAIKLEARQAQEKAIAAHEDVDMMDTEISPDTETTNVKAVVPKVKETEPVSIFEEFAKQTQASSMMEKTSKGTVLGGPKKN